MFQLKLFFSTIFLIYTLSIGYYTIYGISKSYIEYFCTQERPGPPIYQSSNILEELTLPIGRMGYKDKRTVIYNDGTVRMNFTGDDSNSSFKANEVCDGFKWEEKDKNSIFGISDFSFQNCQENSTSFTFLYKIDDEFFSAECGYTFLDEARVVDNCKYVEPSTRELQNNSCKRLNKDNFAIYCVFKKSLKTCDIPLSVQNKFFKTYLVSFIVITLICLFSIFTSTFYDMIIIRILSKIYRFLTGFSIIDLRSPFCNPITGQAIYLEKGEDYVSFYVHDNYEQLPEGDCPFFTDNDGTYFIAGKTLFLFDKENRNDSFQLNEGVKTEISRYFSLIVKNPKFCATNGKNHYLKTKEVIRRMVLGETVKIYKAQNPMVMTDVSEFDIKRIMCLFNIDREITKFLLEHNKRFFKKTLINPLILCLRKKTFFDSRPEDVGNAAWKWYTSDFSQIMKKRGSQYFSQVKWRKSSALVAVENTKEIEVIKCDDLEINVDPKFKIISEYAQKGADRLLNFGLTEEREFLINNESFLFKVDEDREVTLTKSVEQSSSSSSKRVFKAEPFLDLYENLKKEKNVHKIKKEVANNLKIRESILDKMEIKLTGYADAVRKNKIECEKEKVVQTRIETVPNSDNEKERLRVLEKSYDRWVKKNRPAQTGSSGSEERVRKSIKIFEGLSSKEEREEIINFKKVKVVVDDKRAKPISYLEYCRNSLAIKGILDPYLKCKNYYDCLTDMLSDESDILRPIGEAVKVNLKVDDIIQAFKKKGRYKKQTTLASKRLANKKKRMKITSNKYKKGLFKISNFDDIKGLEQSEKGLTPFKELSPEIKKVFFLLRFEFLRKGEMSEIVLDIFEKLTDMERNSINVTKSYLEEFMGNRWPNLIYILTHLE